METNKPKRKVNHKGEARIVVELDANMLEEFDQLCEREGRKIRGYVGILIQQELKRKNLKTVRR